MFIQILAPYQFYRLHDCNTVCELDYLVNINLLHLAVVAYKKYILMQSKTENATQESQHPLNVLCHWGFFSTNNINNAFGAIYIENVQKSATSYSVWCY